jgi:hypothetical protein
MNYFESYPQSDIAFVIVCAIIASLLFIIGIANLIKGIRIRRENNELIVDVAAQVQEKVDELNEIPEPSMNLNERLTYTKDILEFIDSLIDMELIYAKKDELFLKNSDGDSAPLKNTDFDQIISTISSNVFTALKEDVYKSPDNILEDVYLLRYIQKRTVLSYLTYVEAKISNQV